MTSRPGIRAAAIAAVVMAALASAACAPDTAGVTLASDSPGPSGEPRPEATIDAAKVSSLRTAAALDLCPTFDADTAPAAGTKNGLPDIALSCLGDGPAVALGRLRGPYVVNVWGSWCAECSDEAPYLAEVYADPDRTVGFLGIDYLDDPSAGLEAAKELGMKYPAVWSDDDSLRAPLRLIGLPITLFIDADGRVVASKRDGPFASADELRAMIAQYLGSTG